MRLIDFESDLMIYLNALYRQEIPFLEVIHGHGDGVLKEKLREILKTEAAISIEKNESGNDGSTTLRFKK